MKRWLLGSLLLFPLAAGAGDGGVYTWTDANGEVHYTNDPSSPPGDTVLTPVRGEDVSVMRDETRSATAKVPRDEKLKELEVRTAEARAREAEANAERAQAEVARAQADAERYWRETFRDARKKLQLLGDALEREKVILETSGLPVNSRLVGLGRDCYYPMSCAPAQEFERAKVRVKQLEREIAEAKEELRDLERRASHLAIPREWRQ